MNLTTSPSIQTAGAQARAAADAITPGQGQIVPFGRPIYFRGAEKIAVGVRAVNSKIEQILGFGLEVFDIACIPNQGAIEKLGSMRPSDRKRMVDSVIGLTVIEQLGRWASDEALGLTRRAICCA